MAYLQGKVVIITGAGRGIGAEIAKLAALEDAAVLVTDIDAQLAEEVSAAIRSAGGRAQAFGADISDWGGAKSIVEKCVASFGALDGLVNNAGLFRMGRIEEMTEDDLRALVGANILGTAFCARHAAEHMIQQGSGAIVNVTSGAQMGIPMMGAYGATKGAVASFTYAWAAELRQHGIRVNALSPMAKTRMNEVTTRYLSDRNLPLMGNGIEPETNAPIAVYLLSDAARDVTGQFVRIEGRDLSLATHPAVLMPKLSHERWTISAVEEAFRKDLGKRQLPTGVAGITVQDISSGSAFWSAVPK